MRVLMMVFLLWSLALSAQEKGLTPEQVASLKTVMAAELSPDGQTIAYTLSVPRTPFKDENGPSYGELHVWDGERGSRPFITGKVLIGNVKWTPNGAGISFLAKRDDNKEKAIYVIPLDGGEARQVLAHETAIENFDWSPDGQKVAFIAGEVPDEEKKKLEDKGFNQEVFEESPRRNLVWIADLSSSDPKKKLLELEGSANDLAWNPDGVTLAVVKAPTPLVDDTLMNKKAYVIDTHTGKEIMNVNNPGKLGMISWSPDGKKLAMIAGADRNDPSSGRLFVAWPEKGDVKKFFMEDKGDVRQISWLNADTVVYLWDEGVDTGLRTLDLGKGKTESKLDEGGPSFPGLSVASASKRMALVGDTPEFPKEVFLWEEGDTAAKRITFSNPWLEDVDMATQEVVHYQARDGLELQGLLIRPLAEEKGKRYPLIIVVHGGPESHFSNGWITSYSRLGQMAAARGFAVFYPNYRASTGRGVAFAKLDHGRPAMEEFNDIVDAIGHLSGKMGLVDDKKVGVTGGSYGGYATAWCSTALSEHFAAGVMFVGISNKISKAGTSDIPEELYEVHDRKRLWDDWNLFLAQSPIYHVEKARTPLLIMHGKNDTRVHPSQSMELYRHLKTLGKVPVRLVFYPDEGHGNRRSASRYDYSLRTLRWFDHYLLGSGGEKPPMEIEYRFQESEGESD